MSEDIENVSLDILAQKRLEEGLILQKKTTIILIFMFILFSVKYWWTK